MNNELYHYGIPGMRWGNRRGKSNKTLSKSKSKTKSDTKNAKIKLSKGKKIAIGATAAGAALAGIGVTFVASMKIRDRVTMSGVVKGLLENL